MNPADIRELGKKTWPRVTQGETLILWISEMAQHFFVLGRELSAQLAEINERLAVRSDNPRCFCPDCGADLGNFYSNRIEMKRSGDVSR